MLNFKQKLLIYFTALSAGALLISNLCAVKLWNFFDIAVDGGVILFPFTYILGDLTIEFYGQKNSKNIIFFKFSDQYHSYPYILYRHCSTTLSRLEPTELFSKRIRVHAKDHSWLFDSLCLIQSA